MVAAGGIEHMFASGAADRGLPCRAVPSRPRAAPLVLVALGLLVVVGFLLRLRGIDQTLYGDEYFTYLIVTRNGLRGVWDAVYHTSITPPLHYVLAWGALKLGGDPTVAVRLPSLVLGTLTIPVVFALGRRVAGDVAGLLAAALFALGPFAVWYSDEARAYATMMFLLAVAALALLIALDGGRRRWWVVFAVASCAAVWSHYTAAFVVVASLAWAAWARREHLRAVAWSAAGIALGYAPWLPGFVEQRRNKRGIEAVDQFATLHPSTPLTINGRILFGHPFFELGRFPGTVATALLLLLVAALLVAGLLAGRDRDPEPRRPGGFWRSDLGLLVVLALATTAGVLLYRLSGTSLFLPRNLGASLPAGLAAIAAGLVWAAHRLPAPVGAAGLALVVAWFAVDAARAAGDGYRRPPYREAAQYIDAHGRDGDPVVELSANLGFDPRLPDTTLGFYLRRPHPVTEIASAPRAYARLRDGRTVWFVAFSDFVASRALRARLPRDVVTPGLLRRARSLGGPDGLARERSETHLEGIVPAEVVAYRGVVSGREVGRRLRWTFGRDVRVVPGALRGEAGFAPAPGTRRDGLVGYALDSAGRPAEWVLAFSGGRLVAASPGGLGRPDVAAQRGRRAFASGWALYPRAGIDVRRVRVYAVSGGRASRLR
jgi:4-amino-4-deoxy-L-arabinose transferase-like glycosyltransferase